MSKEVKSAPTLHWQNMCWTLPGALTAALSAAAAAALPPPPPPPRPGGGRFFREVGLLPALLPPLIPQAVALSPYLHGDIPSYLLNSSAIPHRTLRWHAATCQALPATPRKLLANRPTSLGL